MDVTILSPRVAAWSVAAVLIAGGCYGGWLLIDAAANYQDRGVHRQQIRIERNISENDGKLVGMSLYGADPAPPPTDAQIEAAMQRYLTNHAAAAGHQSELTTLRSECQAASAVAITFDSAAWLRGCYEGVLVWAKP